MGVSCTLRILEILNEVFNDIDEYTLPEPVNNFDDDDDERLFTGLDDLFGNIYGDLLDDFSADPDAVPG